MKLIDAERLEAEGWKMERMRHLDGYTVLFEKKKPTEFEGVEAAEIVRCRDCYHHSNRTGFCSWWSWYGTVYTEDDGYCNFGERGDGNDEQQGKRRVPVKRFRIRFKRKE